MELKKRETFSSTTATIVQQAVDNIEAGSSRDHMRTENAAPTMANYVNVNTKLDESLGPENV